MRTTVTFDDDVAAAIETVRRRRSVGLSAAVNDLIRAGLRTRGRAPRYRPRSQRLGLSIDVTDVADAIEQLDGPTAR